MPKIPTLNGREILRVLLKAGFYIHHQSGSHARLFHNKRTELRVTVPVHNKDLPEKTIDMYSSKQISLRSSSSIFF